MSRETFREEALSHANLLYRLARLYAHTPPAAEDLVQGTYLRAFECRGEPLAGPGLRTWLTATLRDLALRRMQPSRETGPDPGPRPNVPAALSLENVLPQELDSSLRSLPEPGRSVLWLADAESFRYEEIAESTALSVPEIRSALAQARSTLASDLSAYAAAHGYLRAGS